VAFCGRGKSKGDFTHYGDQTFVLLESVAQTKGFELQDFATRWKRLFEDYKGYFDQATQVTMHNLSKGKEIGDAGGVDFGIEQAGTNLEITRRNLGSLLKGWPF